MESNQIFYNVLENFPLFICVVDKGSKEVVYCNSTAHHLIEDGGLQQLLKHTQADQEGYTVSFLGKWFDMKSVDTVWLDGSDAQMFIGVDVTDVKKTEDLLTANAATDGMTGILNRQAGMDFLQLCHDSVAASGAIFTVSYMDLNDLKYINDNLGHVQGDIYIKTVVDVIQNAIRKTDYFCRMGGDEFLIVFPNCGYKVVENIMEIVVGKLDVINAEHNDDRQYSISYGILEVNSVEESDIEHVLNTVDRKMYYMKEEYRRTKGKRRPL